MTHTYKVDVGRICTAYEGTDRAQALRVFETLVAFNEQFGTVTLLRDGVATREHERSK